MIPPQASSVSVSSSTTSKTVSKRRDIDVRRRLLNKLGIFDGNFIVGPSNPAESRKISVMRSMGMGGVIQSSPSTPPLSPHLGILRTSVSFLEPLKYTKNTPDQESAKDATATATAAKKKGRRGIAFADSVSVLPIPRRNEYSNRIRSRIWSNKMEIHENARRNALEFAAEGWDWRNATEDEGMFVCTVSGELVHPVHCQQYYCGTNQTGTAP